MMGYVAVEIMAGSCMCYADGEHEPVSGTSHACTDVQHVDAGSSPPHLVVGLFDVPVVCVFLHAERLVVVILLLTADLEHKDRAQ